MRRAFQPPNDEKPTYTTWHQVAGYFDGDRGVTANPEMYTISLGLDWADTFRPQLEGVRRFLTMEGMMPQRIYASSKPRPVWHLRLSNRSDLLRAMPRMAPLLIKKRDQVAAAILYLSNQVTGEQLMQAFNRAIADGTRSGYHRAVEMPYIHSQGVAKAKENLGKGPTARWKISSEVMDRARSRKETGATLREICEAFGVSSSSIQRALAREREDTLNPG